MAEIDKTPKIDESPWVKAFMKMGAGIGLYIQELLEVGKTHRLYSVVLPGVLLTCRKIRVEFLYQEKRHGRTGMDYPNKPVVCSSIDDSEKFCRLEGEWKKVAD
jgi:hypothetical protein